MYWTSSLLSFGPGYQLYWLRCLAVFLSFLGKYRDIISHQAPKTYFRVVFRSPYNHLMLSKPEILIASLNVLLINEMVKSITSKWYVLCFSLCSLSLSPTRKTAPQTGMCHTTEIKVSGVCYHFQGMKLESILMVTVLFYKTD